MDAIIPENISFLNLISDKNNQETYLQNEENSNNSDPVFAGYIEGEPIWAIDGVPVCISGSTSVDEGETTVLLNQSENSEETSEMGFPVEIPEKGIVTSSGLFFSNELLLQLNLQNQENFVKKPVQVLNQYIIKDGTTTCFTELLQNDHVIDVVEDKLIENDKREVVIKKNNVDVEVVKKVEDVGEKIEDNEEQKLLEYVEVVPVFKCRKCFNLYEDYESLLNHLKNECQVLPIVQKPQFCPKVQKMSSLIKTDKNKQPIVKDIFLCGICENVGYESIAEVQKHMVTKHDLSYDDRDKGNHFDEEEKSKKKVVNRSCFQSILDMQRVEGKKIKCLMKGCDSRFQRVELMMRHHDCHVEGEKKKFKCPECGKFFFLWRLCSSHMWKCHNIDVDQYTCPLCNVYKSLSPRNFLAHMATHESPQAFKPFLCAECGQDFKLLSQLKNHEATHNQPEKEPSSWIKKKSCTICNKYFSNAKVLKKHVQTVHNKFKPFICNICGHNSSRKAMLELHLRQHTGEKPYKCEICDYKTGDHNSLRRHKLRHFGETQYSCPHCDYQTIQSISFKNHIKRKHPGKEGYYKCLLCPFNSVNEQLHMDHMKEHEIKGVPFDKLEEISKSSEKQKVVPNMEDEETQSGLFADHVEDTIDTGGITIPADSEMQVD